MKRVFGKKKTQAPAPTLDQASAGIGGRVDQMDVKIAALDKELMGYRKKLNATKNPAAKKTIQKRAMDVLKRKKMYENQRDQMAGQQFNLDQAAFGIESAKATVDSVAAMKVANTQLKQAIQKDLDIDAVDDIADDMEELMLEMNDINDALGRNFATPEDISADDLEAELEMLEDELEEEEDALADSTPDYLQEPSLPVEPSTVPQKKEEISADGIRN